MSTPLPPKPNPSAPGPRPVPPPGAGNSAALDPIKLLKKWKLVLVAAVMVGGVLGVVGHFVWLKTYPIYRSTVTYEALPPQDETLMDASTIDQEAMEQFMATQADRMLSPTILERVAQDPRLQAEAPVWADQFKESNGTFNDRDARSHLDKLASANPVGGTYYVRMSVAWKNPNDCAGIAKLLREAYLNDLQRTRQTETADNRTALNTAIQNTQREIDNLTEQRDRLIRDEEVTGLQEQATVTRERLSLIARERNILSLELRAMETQLERMGQMVGSEGGVRYSDTQRQMVEQSPIVQQFKANLEMLEARLNELRRTGIQPDHREYRMTENQIAATEQQLSVTRERELAKLFDAEKDALESEIRMAHAKEADLVDREEDLEVLLQDMTRTITEIIDITDQIAAENEALTQHRQALRNLETATSTAASNRMIVRERERIPDEISMPKIMIMIPLGVMVITGLTCAVILGTEFLDQRVKSPADLAAMSRTRILGTIPLADEDPAVKGTFDTVMRDARRSVVAESFRQIRTSVVKKLDEGGHKTCLVFSGMPGSGASSTACNLALACGGIDRRVLLIDANFRRPRLHKMLGLREAPGLGELLAGEASFESVVQTVDGDGEQIDVIPAGGASRRIFERLGTQAMTEVLAQAGESYDITFVDTAPAIVAGDANSLAQRCDASVMVTRAMAETRGMVGRVKNEFADAPADLLGVVVNAVRSAAGGYMKRNIRTSTEYHAHGAAPAGKPGQSGSAGESAA